MILRKAVLTIVKWLMDFHFTNSSQNYPNCRILVKLKFIMSMPQADTCIIYDSDWNPQNDLQAMARCHRYDHV